MWKVMKTSLVVSVLAGLIASGAVYAERMSYYDFERLLPDSPMLVYYCGGAAAMEHPGRDTAAASIWLDEGLKESLSGPYNSLVAMISQVGFLPQPAINVGVPLIESLAASPWCLVIESLDLDFEAMGAGPPGEGDLAGLRLAWIIHAPPESRAKEVTGTIQTLLSLSVPPDALEEDGPVTRVGGLPVPVAWGGRDNLFVMALGEGVAEAIFDDEPPGPGRAFIEKRQKITGEREPLGLMHVEYEKLIDFFQQAAATAGDAEAVGGMDKLKELLPSFSWALTAEGKGLRDVTMIPIGETPLFQPDIHLVLDDLRAVPENARAVYAIAGDYARGIEDFEEYFVQPGMAADFEKSLEKFESELGFCIREDLLPSLGEKGMVYVTEWAGTRDYPDPVLYFTLSDPDAFSACLTKIERWIEEKAGEDETVSFVAGEPNGVSFASLVFEHESVPFDPAWTVSGERFVLSGTSQGLKSALEHLASENADSILDSREFRNAFDTLGRDVFTSLYYIDSGAKTNLVETLYGLLPDRADLEGTFAEELDFDPAALPPAETLSRHMFATMQVTCYDNDMMFADGFGPFGGATTHMKAAYMGGIPAMAVYSLVMFHRAMEGQQGMDMEPPRETETPTLSREALKALIGPVLVDAEIREVSSSVLEDKDYVLLYFSAEWCPPCRQFTPSLVGFYDQHADEANLEIILVSSDGSAEDMQNYMRNYGMDFLAVPHARVGPSRLSEKYGVLGIPRLVALDGEGKVIKDSDVDGREAMLSELAEMF